MVQRNLLLAGGERLVSKAEIVRGGGPKKKPYTLEETRRFLREPLADIRGRLHALPDMAKPRGEAVFELTLHPAFLARSHYPAALLAAAGLRDVGSRERTIIPKKTTNELLAGKEHSTASLFVAGSEIGLSKLSGLLEDFSAPASVKNGFIEIEAVQWIMGNDKLRGNLPEDRAQHSFEVALHASGEEEDIVVAFRKFAKSLGIDAQFTRRIRAGGLTFMPVVATSSQVKALADFSFLRVARPMPELRMAIPNGIRQELAGSVKLPTEPALLASERAAIFDGGLGSTDLELWARETSYAETAETRGQYFMHGSEVTSTFLFGPVLNASDALPRPYMAVDHFRVLAPSSGRDPDLFDVLLRIKGVLESGQYRFANFSLGPRMPICDDEVHVWTATIDQLCAQYDILATVAVGNDGNEIGADRIQPPGDMVNSISVGACNTVTGPWGRAPYSCIGPGRSPGFVKPDGVAFGGVEGNLFPVYSPITGAVSGVCGTSYAAPLVLRTAAGAAALTTYELSSIALKALLIHHAEPGKVKQRAEVGWGRFVGDPMVLLECAEDSATIVFQGSLAKGQFRRCPIPFPDVALNGPIGIRATFCINAHTDPEHAINYTRSGMGVTFRPRFGIDEQATSDFFGIRSQYRQTESELRGDAHKWETCLHRAKTFRAPHPLVSPVFDVEYHARASSRSVAPKSAPDVDFALVVTVSAPGVPGIYDLIRQKYSVLTPVQIRSEITVAGT